MSEEKDLIKKRGSFKGQLTNFITYVNQLTATDMSSVIASELQMRLNRMEIVFSQYDEVQLQLECIAENSQAQFSDRTEFESKYYTAMAKAQHFLNSIYKKETETIREQSSCASTRKQSVVKIKLPVINLPKFGGSYENWLEFHDTFESLIHSNDDIENINKFHYLRSSLEGSAAVVIQSMEFSSDNYEVAWSLLCDRYDNKRLLLQNHVSAIFNIEPITKESSFALKRTIDQLNKNLRALQKLGEPVQQWGTLLIHILSTKLDSKTYREWEEYKGRLDKDTAITLDTFLTFMRNRADFIETIELSSHNATGRAHTQNKNTPKLKTMVSMQGNKQSTVTSLKCPKCNGDHILSNCPLFLSLTNSARLSLLPSLKVCYNCFRSGHYANHCKRPGCKLCKRKHHTLVHVEDFRPNALGHDAAARNDGNSVTAPALSAFCTAPVSATTLAAPAPTTSSGGNNNQAYEVAPVTMSTLSARLESTVSRGQDVLLSTALIKVYDKDNCEHIARAIFDSGSTSCLMTTSMFNKLNLQATSVNKSIQGINNSISHVGKMCRVPIQSLNDSYATNITCFILSSITDDVPCRQIDLTNIHIPSDICLADPNFYYPSAVDIIIGADVFWDVVGSKIIKLGIGQPVLCETRFGFLVSGPINSRREPSNKIKCCFSSTISNNGDCTQCSHDDIQNQLTRFWQLEEVSHKSSHLSPEEKLCEEHFERNTTRLTDGRFCVKLPIKDKQSVLGNSFNRAKHCLLSFERRVKTKPEFKALYSEFLSEYQNLGHMTENEQVNDKEGYFIPHHGVLRDSSSTTKLRVVFNASSPTTSGVSLNNILMVGATVQDDLLSILLRFRQHKYILSADVEKMYRQIVVHPDDRHLQQIVWRENELEPLKTYSLNTVTYGTASAPFLATRCLRQIGTDCADKIIGEVITHDFYVDDLLTGGDVFSEVVRIRQMVTNELAAAGMNLRKWNSNELRLLSEPSLSTVDLNMGSNEPSKTLGLGWHSKSDELCFPIGTSLPTGNTKRDMLSVIAQIFDPLGLLSPCVISMKMLMQRLWLQKLTWDEPLSPELVKQWSDIVVHLPALNHVRIPRRVICDSPKMIELHIFSDSSERAYGSCVYIRSVDRDDQVTVRLLMAKSRVAPIKPTTIPKLELCGALVGARLYDKVLSSLRVQVQSTTFWTDSTIVLGWLKMLPSKLQPFVRNRVANILELTGSCVWRHVPTDQNPADLISRGVPVQALHSLDLWWSGPTFLQEDHCQWPVTPNAKVTLPETREVSLHASVNNNTLIDFERFSNLSRLKRTIAYAVRFINKCRKQTAGSRYLSDDELKYALNIIIKETQKASFPEYSLLINKQKLPNKNSLLKFNVFIDENNIMRVGGRLHNSDFSYEKKHPILLQSTHRFTKLLFAYEHKKLLHAPPQLLLATIKETYWPIGGRNLVKLCFHQCVLCNRMKGQTLTPIMGNLPKNRLLPGGFPFSNCVGVDYAGPITSASRQGRGCRLVKVYIAVFICFSTKAIHLELVGDLTSNSYMLALRRFISRRGKPKIIYSDNGTTFVGAFNELSKFLKNNCNSLAETVANEEIKFSFIPAYAPHFGGLWEAGVKSTKYHLLRVLGNCHLTYEELNTTLVEIEALLNSRPLTPLSSHPEDVAPLTPGHFFIGRPLTSLPAPELRDCTPDRLPRYKRIEQLRQHFWSRWSKEYVAELQHRVKWRSNQDSLKLDALVLIKEDNLPPLKWKLGRVTAIHPGTDGVSRVADIRTATGVVRRAFSKICPLPVSDSNG